VQPAQVAHDLRARPQEQVIRVRQQHACAQIAQLGRCDALDTACRADDAEERRLDITVRRAEGARPCAAAARLVRDV
jgi:hypothetical protein